MAGRGEEVFREACRLGVEGIVSKRADSPYHQKRSRHWLKVKCLLRQEFVIGGFTEPSRPRTGPGALLLGYYRDGTLVYAGRVGTGFSRKTLGLLAETLPPLEQDEPPFQNSPAGGDARQVHWIRPELIAEVEFTEWTGEGHLRHPSFKGLREERSPRDIVREPAAGAGLSGKKQRGRRASNAPGIKKVPTDAVVEGVRLSSPDRILYPDQGLTKKTLAGFYVSIADYILPHIARRPLAVLRCPEGRREPCFYQKNVRESTPDHIRGVPVAEKKGTVHYFAIDDLKGLVSLVQMGVLEIHPWGSRESDVGAPDILTFDLDPGPGLGWNDVTGAARFLRERLEDLGLESFLKTSGGKGLHLVVPIVRRTGWDELREFAEAVARDLARLVPGRFTAGMSKAGRRGKIFVDYLRNRRGATTVAAYSTRARENAPVSTPIRWDELSRATGPDAWTVANLPRRLAALKSDPWSGYFGVRQSITRRMRKELGLR